MCTMAAKMLNTAMMVDMVREEEVILVEEERVIGEAVETAVGEAEETFLINMFDFP